MHCSSIPVRVRLAAGLALFGATVLPAHEAFAGAIVVGQSTANNGPCTVSSIQAAINRANGFGGYNLILVTDDVADGVHHENLNLNNLRNDLSLEIVGGYNNCADLQPTASGKASIYGGGRAAPVMNISGRVDLKMRGFWMEGGDNGIRWSGRGRVELVDTTINNNDLRGIWSESSGGEARLDLFGGVEISNHESYSGILARGTQVRIRGNGNTIRNNFYGILATHGSTIDIGATGAVVRDNNSTGLYLLMDSSSEGSSALLYSTDAANPLTLSGNGTALQVGGLSQKNHLQRACLKNVTIHSNRHAAMSANSPGNQIDVDSLSCQFPPEAAITCRTSEGSPCSAIRMNGEPGQRLISATHGGRIDLRNTSIERNVASSILSTNLGDDTPSTSAITLTGSVVRYNTVRDNLFEALHGGIVDLWDSTVFSNTGGFQVSLVGINPGLLQATNTIIDQPQAFLAYEGAEPWNTRYTRVLAQNRTGAPAQSEFLIGRPTYADAYGRLAPQSLGIDYAPAGGGVDLDGNPRDVDTIGRPNTHGPRDLGAFENQTGVFDRIFASGFD